MPLSLINPENVLAAIFYGSAGMLILIFAYGRILAHLSETILKRVLVKSTLVICTVVFVALGFWRGLDIWLVVPAVVWLCAGVLEVERIILKRKYKGAGPVFEDVPKFSLFKPVTTEALAIRRYELPVEQWREGKLRIVHISDVHVHGTLTNDYFHGVTKKISGLNPDIVVITGDFISRVQYAKKLPETFEGLDAPRGVFACLGNHDYWAGAGEVADALAETNIVLLQNESRVIEAGAKDRLVLSGCEDPWGKQEWSAPESGGDNPLVVLSHTADNVYKLSEAGALAVFSGHNHAGQAAVPWYGPLVIPSRYGRIFDHGHFLVDRTHLYVTAGVGVAFPPLRVYCHPEILVVDLVAGQDN